MKYVVYWFTVQVFLLSLHYETNEYLARRSFDV